MTLTRIVLLSVVCSLTVGCHAFRKDDDVQRDWLGREVELEYGQPSNVVAIWTNSVLSEAGSVPVRGLGGRVYFYDNNHRAVPVEGSLTVFVYDDSEDDAGVRQEATRKLTFSAEELAANYAPTDFGPSYNVWVPWDAVGGERKQLSVIPVYKSEAGQMLVGNQARHLLPGRAAENLSEDGTVLPASFTSHSTQRTQVESIDRNETVAARERSRAETIQLPPSMQQRLKTRQGRKPTGRQAGEDKQSRSKRTGENSWNIYDRFDAPHAKRATSRLPQESHGDQSETGQPEAATTQPSTTRRRAVTPIASSMRPLTRSAPSRLQAPSVPFAPRSDDHARSLLRPAKSLFDRQG